jgi:hypothetical protein
MRYEYSQWTNETQKHGPYPLNEGSVPYASYLPMLELMEKFELTRIQWDGKSLGGVEWTWEVRKVS